MNMCWDVVMKTNKSEIKKKYTNYTDFVRTENGSLVNIKTMKIVNEMVHTNKNDFNQIMNRVGV